MKGMPRKSIASNNWRINRIHRQTGAPFKVCRALFHASHDYFVIAYYECERYMDEIRAELPEFDAAASRMITTPYKEAEALKRAIQATKEHYNQMQAYIQSMKDERRRHNEQEQNNQ